MKFKGYVHSDEGYNNVSKDHGPIMFWLFEKCKWVVFKELGHAQWSWPRLRWNFYREFKTHAWRYPFGILEKIKRVWSGDVEINKNRLFPSTSRFFEIFRGRKGTPDHQ